MEFIYLVVIGTAIWAAVDVQQYRNRYRFPGLRGPSMSLGQPHFGDVGAGSAAWFFACLLIWIVAFPLYLARRGRPPPGADPAYPGVGWRPTSAPLSDVGENQGTHMNLVRYLPSLDLDEQVALAPFVRGLTEDELQSFAAAYMARRKDPQTILLTSLVGFLGVAGIHRFILGQVGMGLLHLFTLGFFGIGTIIDAVNHKKLAATVNLEEARKVAFMVQGTGRRAPAPRQPAAPRDTPRDLPAPREDDLLDREIRKAEASYQRRQHATQAEWPACPECGETEVEDAKQTGECSGCTKRFRRPSSKAAWKPCPSCGGSRFSVSETATCSDCGLERSRSLRSRRPQTAQKPSASRAPSTRRPRPNTQ